MSESKTIDADTINELIKTARNAGAVEASYFTVIDAFEMAEAISNWLLDESNGSREFAVKTYEIIKSNIMKFLDLSDPKYFSLAFEIFAKANLRQAVAVAGSFKTNWSTLSVKDLLISMVFSEEFNTDTQLDFVLDVLPDKEMYPVDQFPPGLNLSKSKDVISQLLVQIILFMSSALDGQNRASLFVSDAQFKTLLLEFDKEKQSTKAQKHDFDSQLALIKESFRKEMHELRSQIFFYSPGSPPVAATGSPPVAATSSPPVESIGLSLLVTTTSSSVLTASGLSPVTATGSPPLAATGPTSTPFLFLFVVLLSRLLFITFPPYRGLQACQGIMSMTATSSLLTAATASFSVILTSPPLVAGVTYFPLVAAAPPSFFVEATCSPS